MGKTTLARSVTQSLPMRVHWVAGTESARPIPLGAFAHLVSPATSRNPTAFLAAALEAIRRGEDSIIGVDDAHLLDPLSATLVHQLALEGSVRIVAALRTGESVPDAITSLWKDGYLKRLRVTPFTNAQCVGLVEEALGAPLEGLSADLMWEASAGNALFVRHLVEGALEAGTLRQVRGVWVLRGGIAVTSELASLLEARFQRLPEDVVHALRLLAFAEPLALDTLTVLVGADTVERAEGRGLVRVVEDPNGLDVRFNHPLFGEVIRRGLGRVCARRLKGELFRAMQQQLTGGPIQRIRLAELVLDSDVTADSDLFVAAAQDALALTNVVLTNMSVGECVALGSLSERLARAAVSRGGGLVASEVLARSLLRQGNAAESDRILSAFDPAGMTEVELARWGVARIANLHWAMGDVEGANEVFELLRGRLTHPALRLVVDGVASACLLFENQLSEAVALTQDVLAAPDAPAAAVEWAVGGALLALALMGRGDEVAAVAERGHAIESKVDGLLRFLARFGEVRALALAGDFENAEARSGDIVRVFSPGQYMAWGLAKMLAGTVDVARGRFQAAVSRMEDTVAALTSESAAPWSFPARLLLARSYCALGRVEPAAKTIANLRSLMGRHVAVFEPQLRSAEAWLAAAEGHVTGAITAALEAADLAERSGQRAIEILALHDAARFGDRSSLQRLVEVAESVSGPLATAYAAHGVGLLNCDAAAVYSAAQRFEQIGALLSAADAAAQAATLFEAAGDRCRTIDAAATADRLAVACGGIQTPALEMSSHSLPLSPREREIADMVAQGWSTREIADRLVVSTRTVEGHIYRACIKLDVSDRQGLAVLIRRSGGT